jgi:hypothetical protein
MTNNAKKFLKFAGAIVFLIDIASSNIKTLLYKTAVFFFEKTS